jgi:hypothetical protein
MAVRLVPTPNPCSPESVFACSTCLSTSMWPGVSSPAQVCVGGAVFCAQRLLRAPGQPHAGGPDGAGGRRALGAAMGRPGGALAVTSHRLHMPGNERCGPGLAEASVWRALQQSNRPSYSRGECGGTFTCVCLGFSQACVRVLAAEGPG